MMRRSAARILVAAAAISTFAAATAHAAVVRSGGYSYVTKRTDLQGGETRVLGAPCPSGTRVLSGGGYNTGGFDTGVATHSYPADDGDRGKKPDDAWKVKWTTEADVEIRAYAVCADKRVRYLMAPRSLSAEAASRGEFSAGTCDAGFDAFGGGSSGPIRAAETMSYRQDTGFWRVLIDQAAGGAKSRLKVFSICAKPLATVVSSSDSAAPGTQAHESITCPAGTRVVGGGILHNSQAYGSRHVLIAASRPFGFGGPEDDGWEAWIDNHRPADAVTFTVQALCLPPAN